MTDQTPSRAAQDEPTVIHVHHHDIESHAESFNQGYETAVAQGLADDPTLAQDWLTEHDERVRAAARTAWEADDGWRQMKAQRDAARADAQAAVDVARAEIARLEHEHSTVPVTRVQRDAARLRLKVDAKVGQPSDPAVEAIAAADDRYAGMTETDAITLVAVNQIRELTIERDAARAEVARLESDGHRLADWGDRMEAERDDARVDLAAHHDTRPGREQTPVPDVTFDNPITIAGVPAEDRRTTPGRGQDGPGSPEHPTRRHTDGPDGPGPATRPTWERHNQQGEM